MSKKSEYVPTKTYARLTSGQALRIMRELQGLSQVDLSRASGVTQTAISALERDRETLGVERAKSLAAALRIHPAVLVFPDLAPSGRSPKPPTRPTSRSFHRASPVASRRVGPTPDMDAEKLRSTIATLQGTIDQLTAASARAAATNVRGSADDEDSDDGAAESSRETERGSTTKGRDDARRMHKKARNPLQTWSKKPA
jgi:transcriptional regulator with XRE-family HTH domain